MRNRNVQRIERVAAGIVAMLLLVAFGYIAAGLFGGALPANRDWVPPSDGVTIYIESNGIHTALVFPKEAAGVDWRGVARAGDLRDPRFADWDHVAFSWGEQAFFLDTPTWADVRARTVMAAAVGSDRMLVHVEHIPTPPAEPWVRRVVLRPEEYRRLARFVRATIVADGARYPGYAGFDAFYQARGHYDAIATCNEWTGRALRFAGIRVGRWTPFPETVLWWFPRGDQSIE